MIDVEQRPLPARPEKEYRRHILMTTGITAIVVALILLPVFVEGMGRDLRFALLPPAGTPEQPILLPQVLRLHPIRELYFGTASINEPHRTLYEASELNIDTANERLRVDVYNTSDYSTAYVEVYVSAEKGSASTIRRYRLCPPRGLFGKPFQTTTFVAPIDSFLKELPGTKWEWTGIDVYGFR